MLTTSLCKKSVILWMARIGFGNSGTTLAHHMQFVDWIIHPHLQQLSKHPNISNGHKCLNSLCVLPFPLLLWLSHTPDLSIFFCHFSVISLPFCLPNLPPSSPICLFFLCISFMEVPFSFPSSGMDFSCCHEHGGCSPWFLPFLQNSLPLLLHITILPSFSILSSLRLPSPPDKVDLCVCVCVCVYLSVQFRVFAG